MTTILKKLFTLICLSGFATAAFAQLQWSSYDKNGNLVAANVASGGDATYGRSANFSVPLGTELIFTTKSFMAIGVTNSGQAQKINFTMTADGGLNTGPLSRIFGIGLLNDPNTLASAADDLGYWCDFNSGNPGFEMFYRPKGMSTFFQYDSSHKLSTGAKKTGYPTNSIIYGMQFQLNNSGGTGISIGTSSSTFAASGAAMTNSDSSVFQTAYTSANPFSTLTTSNFNEFAFMFNNTTTSNVTVTLSGITLVPLNPGIDTNPVDFNGNPAGTATFSLAINTNSVTPLTYQWYEISGGMTNMLTDGTTANSSIISGSTTNTLTISNDQIADSGYVFVVITNIYGSAQSIPALFNVANDSLPVIFSLSLTNANLLSGQGTNISVRASGVPAPVYYWFDNNSNLLQSGSSSTLILSDLQFNNTGTYSVVASNYLGAVSTNFIISLYVAPCISQPPTNVLVNLGDPVTFSVGEGGCAVPAPTYQWYKNGSPISGATSFSYSIANVALTNIGNYSVTLSNPGGSISSASAKLAIYSASMIGSPIYPANGSAGLCVDTYFKISFNKTPTIGNSGKIYIYNTDNPSSPVDTIDMSLNSAAGVQPHSLFAGDSQPFNYYPIMISGDTATIYPHSGILTNGGTYYVTMEPGVIVDSDGAYFSGISDSNIWKFSTKEMGPANATNLVVAVDGSGDFLTIQGAVDFIPLNNANYTLINVRNGTYTEIVDIASKNKITFRGQSRTGTIVGYPNNANIAPGGTTHARMAFKVDANDIAVENMTIVNTTPQGGSQAEALMIESGAARFILNNAEVDSRQDTILANVNSSQGYFYNSLIQGNFDYVWGGGNLFFTNCELRTIPTASSYNLAAPRTDNGATGNWPGYSGLLVSNGLSFVSCRLTVESGVTGCMMSDHNGTANGLAAWINCSIDTADYANADATAQTTQLLWEHGCSNLDNTVALDNTAAPFLGFTQLDNGDPRLMAAESATNWLNGWIPQLAPNIISQPISVATNMGHTVSFVVMATGIPDASYQWFNGSSPVLDATNAVYTINDAQPGNNGTYSVVVSNSVGVVTSSNAMLTVSTDHSPVAGPTTYIRPMGVPLNILISSLATNWTDADSDSLALIGGMSSTNGATVSYDSSYIHYNNPNNVNDQINYTITDGQGADANGLINIVIGPPPTNSIAGAVVNSDGTVTLNFVGVSNYTYQVEAATNLVPPIVWMPVSTNVADENGLWQFTDQQMTNYPQRFYRSLFNQ